MNKDIFDEIFQQLENGENPTPPDTSVSTAKDMRGLIFADRAMVPRTKVSDSGIRSLDESADSLLDA